jgi:hypothetical protein
MTDKIIDASEYFEELYGHTYNSSYSSIDMIKFAEAFAKQNTLNRDKVKTAEEFLNDKFNGKGYEFKIHDWINGQVSNYSPCELLEEYAQQNTLNRDKVDAILYDCFRFSDHYGESAKKALDAICSLSPPTLSDGEIQDKLGEYARRINKEYNYYSVRERSRMIDGYEAALKELTKPKEE